MAVSEALLVRVAFPRGAYSGSELGGAEEVPSPARIHAAFLAAAAGGPFAGVEGRVLVAGERHRTALRWLEDHEPLAIRAPATRLTDYSAQRYRLRAAATTLNRTEFEPLCALAGPVTYAWPAPDIEVLASLRELAPEVTHIGRADSTAIVAVGVGELDWEAPDVLAAVPGRGVGRPLRIATPGRSNELAAAHARALAPGRHGSGSKGRQAADEPAESAGESATVLRRFASARTGGPWPFGEAWRVPFEGLLPRWCLRIERRVAVCVAIHRAIVAAIGTDVPTFVTGRDGDRPLGGAGHLAIHLLVDSGGSRPEAVLGLPTGVPEADRAALLSVLAARPKVRMGRQRVSLGAPRIGSALPFWLAETRQFATAVPMALDAPGAPRRGGWTLDDAVVCSVGYALRGVLEEGGMAWGTGWSFRQGLVAELRARGVGARARRVMAGASNFVHRARPGDLLVAADAVVDLGDLAPRGAGLLALGRARHLGGGLLRPLAEELP